MSNSDKEFNFKVFVYVVLLIGGLAIFVNVYLGGEQDAETELDSSEIKPKSQFVGSEPNLEEEILEIESPEIDVVIVDDIKPNETEKKTAEVRYIEDSFEERDRYAPHPWFEVNPSAEDLRKCRALERKPLPYTEYYDREQSRMVKKYQPKFTYRIWVRHKSRNYDFEKVFRDKRAREAVVDNLNKTLYSMYADYIALLGGESLYQAHIDIVIAWRSSDYSEILTYYNKEHMISKSAGVYFPSEHLAVSRLPRTIEGSVDWPEFNEIMAHETGHAMNFVQFGYMNRWSQEGIAQYQAHKVGSDYSSLFISRDEWLRASQYLDYPYPFESLLYVEEGWENNSAQLYASAFAYVQYFATQRPDILKQILRLEQQQLCDAVSRAALPSIVDPDSLLYTDMQNWFDQSLSSYETRKAELDKLKVEK